MRTTYMQTAENARENRKWYVIDAQDTNQHILHISMVVTMLS